MLALDKNLSWLCLNYEIYYIRIRYNDIKFEFRCSHKLLALQIEKLTTILPNNTGKPTLPNKILHIDYVKLEKLELTQQHFNSVGDWVEFKKNLSNSVVNPRQLIVDCCEYYLKTLMNCVKIFIEKFKILGINLKNKYYSASSISVKLYFKKFNLIEKKLPKLIENYTRQAYYGGRCEVFGNSKRGETILHYDYRGMYSQCMLEKYPHGG